ncbi:hypothetical protein LTR17_015471 [Elasticomyces elasticus]|nr:hypothetical protein LTR17_015471 [Elasticomyces elasticus]
MAFSPLTTTPTDIMYMIFDLLPQADLRDFRSVCRWAREQSNDRFASQMYRTIHISNIKGTGPTTPIQRAARVFQGNTALAAAVRILCIRLSPSVYGSGLASTDFRDVSYSILEVPGIFATLSGLKKLELHNLTSFAAASRFRVQSIPSAGTESLMSGALGTSWPRLESLSIKTAFLMSQELVAIVHSAGPGLTELRLDCVHTFDRTWPDTLRAILSTAASLDKLELRDLLDQTKEKFVTLSSFFQFRDIIEAVFNKSFRGGNGGATLSLQSREASMVGAEAIKLGLDMIEKHAAAREEARWLFRTTGSPLPNGPTIFPAR